MADAIDRQAWGELKGELGDLLFQSVYHAQMAAEAGHFTFADVVTAISDKMLARHPHVFGAETRTKTAEQQTRDWEAAKAAERGNQRTLDGVALALPALTRAVKLQNRAARVGFDWPSTEEVLDKLVEEAREVTEARATLSQAELTEEIGDLLFVMANLARHLKVDPKPHCAPRTRNSPAASPDRGLADRGRQAPRRQRSGRIGRAVEPRQGRGKGRKGLIRLCRLQVSARQASAARTRAAATNCRFIRSGY